MKINRLVKVFLFLGGQNKISPLLAPPGKIFLVTIGKSNFVPPLEKIRPVTTDAGRLCRLSPAVCFG